MTKWIFSGVYYGPTEFNKLISTITCSGYLFLQKQKNLSVNIRNINYIPLCQKNKINKLYTPLE